MSKYNAYYVGQKITVMARGPASAQQQAITQFNVDDRYASLVIVIRADQDNSNV